MKRRALSIAAATVCIGIGTAALAEDHLVSSAADIARVERHLLPGEAIVLKDGEWADQELVIKAKGTAQIPVKVRAQTPGKVILTGRSKVSLDGDHIVLSGLYLKNIQRDGDALAIVGNHCRVTDCAVVGGGSKFFVHLIGVENRVDHCYLSGKVTADPTLQVEVKQDRPNNNRIDHNHFGYRPPLGRNGGETIRVGYSGQSQWVSGTFVERNLFENCDGEIEIISSKSCENVYRYNTFMSCAGFLTLRHGHRCVVDSNFFIGKNKKGSGGVRVINEGHLVTNNYIEGVTDGGFWITSGIKDGPLTGYTRAKDCVIAFNTVADFGGPGVELSAGLGSSNRTLVPEDVTIANNVFAPGERGELIKGKEGRYEWRGNVVFGAEAAEGKIMKADGTLIRGKNGLLAPEPPASAEGEVASVIRDVEGQPRGDHAVAGADQPGDAEPTNRVLTAKDVGPSWMTDR